MNFGSLMVIDFQYVIIFGLTIFTEILYDSTTGQNSQSNQNAEQNRLSEIY